jgi:hypothetical protein
VDIPLSPRGRTHVHNMSLMIQVLYEFGNTGIHGVDSGDKSVELSPVGRGVGRTGKQKLLAYLRFKNMTTSAGEGLRTRLLQFHLSNHSKQ